MTLLIDTREPWSHPWATFWPADVRVVRGTLETGDVALAALLEGAVVERKTASDLLACIGRERKRFEHELQRSRYVGRLVVVCVGTVADLMCEARRRGGGMSDASILGTLAAWQRRFCPFFFAGNVKVAAEFCERFLRGQIREVKRASKAIAKTGG